MKPRVTIREIAERAGIHFTTVSLALRNSPRIKESTRLRVQAIAKEMGYVPDPMLSALNAYRQTKKPVQYQATLAWIHNWSSPDLLYGSQEFREYYLGAKERAQERGYVLEEFWIREPEMPIRQLHRILRARNIQGALIAPQQRHGGYLDLDYRELSCVTFGYSMQPAVLDVITNHHAHSIAMMLREILALGYKRIGLNIPEDWNAKVENAWHNAMLILHAERPDLARIPTHWEPWESKDESGLKQWIEMHRPDVVISHNLMAERLKQIGFQLPDDIGFASPFLGKDEQVLSGVYQNDFLIGQKAADMVIDMLRRHDTGLPDSPVRMLVEGKWYPGKTLRKQSANLRKKTTKHTTKKSAAK